MKYSVGDHFLVVEKGTRKPLYLGILMGIDELKAKIKWMHTERIYSYHIADIDINIKESVFEQAYWKHLPSD